LSVDVFATELGWLALAGSDATVAQVTYPRASKVAALAALDPEIRQRAEPCCWWPELARRLRDFAAGAEDDFRDVAISQEHLTPFEQRVVKHCRAIGYGRTMTYGQLAAAAGARRAARAVGNTMAGNRFAFIVPCQRVVHAGGDPGRLSGAARTRKQLRALEGGTVTAAPKKRGVRRKARG
jgi:methylated-DNA-[protein]-cysteine S-methyltransferase